jgi:hypothetical protein
MTHVRHRHGATIEPAPDRPHIRQTPLLDPGPGAAVALLDQPLRVLTRHAAHGDLCAVRLLVEVTTQFDDRVAAAVAFAHRSGLSWADIGWALHLTPAQAQRKYGPAAQRRRRDAIEKRTGYYDAGLAWALDQPRDDRGRIGRRIRNDDDPT